MGTISAKRLQGALAQAKDAGLVEEPVTLCGVNLVFRSLRYDEFDQAYAVAVEKDGLNTGLLQKGYIARSIVEINGVDLRDADFIEIEEEDPKKPGQFKTIKVERYQWIIDNVLDSWGREALTIAFKKFNDVTDTSQKKAAEGVTFKPEDETGEDKYRRILSELVVAEQDVPTELADRILDDAGLRRKAADVEYRAAADELSQLADEQAPQAEPEYSEEDMDTAAEFVAQPPAQAAPPPQAIPQPTQRRNFPVPAMPDTREVPPPRAAAPQYREIPGDAAAQEELANLIRTRRQQNLDPVAVAPQDIGLTPKGRSKAAMIAQMEGIPIEPLSQEEAAHLGGGLPIAGAPVEAAVLSRKQDQFDPSQAGRILEQPPTAGINPKFRHHGR